MRRALVKIMATGGALMLCAAASAQTPFGPLSRNLDADPYPPPGSIELRQLNLPYVEYERVDPLVDDVGPLGVSLRRLDPGLAHPIGFEHIYRHPDDPNLLFRASGAVTAVFPRSTYVNLADGPTPTIPPGTVFWIGPPPGARDDVYGMDARVPDFTPEQYAGRIQTRIGEIDEELPSGEGVDPTEQWRRYGAMIGPDARPSLSPGTASAPVRVDESPTIATSSAYRTERVHELMRRAAEASTESERD